MFRAFYAHLEETELYW